MANVPPGFGPHPRKSPVTDPWDPLYSRLRSDGVDLFFEVREAHCNSRGLLHGGVLAALCDNAMGLSLGVVVNDAKVSIVTISLSLDFLGSATLGDSVLIEPRIVRVGSSIGFCDAIVKGGDERIARANASFSVRVPTASPK